MDSASFAWLAVCALLVFLLQAGFATLHTGSARAKNAVHSLALLTLGMAVVSLVFWALGRGLAFGNSAGGWVGTRAVDDGSPPGLAGGLGAFYQTLVAVTPLAIFCGALAERLRTLAVLVFAVVLAALIYPVLAHWTQHPQGWLVRLGLVDGAGNTALHALGAWCALAALLVARPRLGRYGPDGQVRDIAAHNLPMVGLGGWLLWLGWFGLVGAQVVTQGGSDGAAHRLNTLFMNLQLGGSAGLVAALCWPRQRPGTWSLRQALNGGLCGLVALSAGAAVLSPLAAVTTGALAGLGCCWLSQRVRGSRLDDASDALAVHGFGAAWGLLAAGLFFAGEGFNPQRLGVQAVAVLASFAWGFPLAYGCLKLIDRLAGGLRVTAADEMRGLDYAEHHGAAYPEGVDTPGSIKLRR